jgi:hypothetical protein
MSTANAQSVLEITKGFADLKVSIALDKFYTKPEVVDKCVEELRNTLPEVFAETVIEPSAGSGVWMPHFPGIHAFDLAPEGPDIVKQDFFNLDLTQFEGPIHFVGNPPFGSRADLVMGFMKKMSDNINTQSISLIIPATFAKSRCSYHKAINSKFHVIHTSDIQKNGFTIDSKNKNVNCVFQIWVRRPTDRLVAERAKPKGFKWVKKTDIDEDTIAICHKGSGAGRIRDPDWKTRLGTKARDSVSFYYFKLDDNSQKVEFEELYDELTTNIALGCKFNSTAKLDSFYNRRSMGAPGIEKADITAKVNMILGT